jgi:hypothetical protein
LDIAQLLYRRETIGALVFRTPPKARRPDTRRRRLAPVNLRDDVRETDAEAIDGCKRLVRKHFGGFRGAGEIEVGRVGPGRMVGRFASDGLCHGEIGEIGILLPLRTRGFGGRAVLPGRAGACIRAGLLQAGAIARQGWLARGEESIGLMPQRLVQRDAAHHAAAEARADDEDVGGSEKPGGQGVAGGRDMGAEGLGDMPGMLDEIEDEGDKDGEGVEDCGSAGPSPR